MQHSTQIYRVLPFVFLFLMLPVQAHLLPAGTGTLNVRGDTAYMVLSVPVSAFPELDRSGDGNVSIDEFNAGRLDTVGAVEAGIWLDDGHTRLRPEHVLLSPASATHSDRIDDVSILAKFSLSSADATPTRFSVTLFGQNQERMIINARQKAAGLQANMTLRPDRPEVEFSWM